ncbi:MAG: hypothetical protein KME42_16995 [Tildeniella nuda ZEHNDER 1965/U140]|nr:hypothetical protein [Tildeniella nuda ZEHNDER 1965/U140]
MSRAVLALPKGCVQFLHQQLPLALNGCAAASATVHPTRDAVRKGGVKRTALVQYLELFRDAVPISPNLQPLIGKAIETADPSALRGLNAHSRGDRHGAHWCHDVRQAKPLH